MTSLAELVALLPPPAPAAPALPTGIAALDAVLLGGGLPRGRLTELVGPTGSGKTTLARVLVETTVAAKGWVAWVDAQRTLDARDWTHLGDAQGVWMIRPHDATRAAWCADVLLRSGAFALVVLDGAPLLSKSNAVRLTRLARESNAAFVVLGERAGGATQLGGSTRLVVERPSPSARRSWRRPPPRLVNGGEQQQEEGSACTIVVRVEKGGTLRTVEVSCAIPVARRLCAHPEVPDRRGVARGPSGGSRHARGSSGQRAASPPPQPVGQLAGIGSTSLVAGGGDVSASPPRELRTAVRRARALG